MPFYNFARSPSQKMGVFAILSIITKMGFFAMPKNPIFKRSTTAFYYNTRRGEYKQADAGSVRVTFHQKWGFLLKVKCQSF